MTFTSFVLVWYALVSISLYKVFEKAGRPGWQALVPGYNLVVWAELVGRTKVHAFWMLFPIVNIFIIAALAIDLFRSFGRHSFLDAVFSVVLMPLAMGWLGFDKAKYQGPILTQERDFQVKLKNAQESGNKALIRKLEAQGPSKRSAIREWTESIIFAVFAAAFIRMFLIEMYQIPTSSMEGSLLVGDFLCVSKAHYGVRPPMTIAMIPLLHNRIPGLQKESYVSKPSLKYRRLPAFDQIGHNDPVVFNYPEGDSVIITPGRTYSVYDLKRMRGGTTADIREPIVTRPIDKKDHYIKRCIGLPGDSLQIIDRQVYINGSVAPNPSKIQFEYVVRSHGTPLNTRKLVELGVNIYDRPDPVYMLNSEQVEQLRSAGNITVDLLPQGKKPLFPYEDRISKDWTVNDYGPIYIPKKGTTVPLTDSTLAFYRRVIETYEGNELRLEGSTIFINGQVVTDYTFQMDYYWMMGDNRHNSEDSRIWGFVPEDHIVGKPLFIWFSTKFGSLRNGVRWNRLFTSAKKP